MNLPPHGLAGKLIVFEGVDGAGKTTLLEHAGRVLEERGVQHVETKMPSQRVRGIEEFKLFHYSHDPSERQRVSPFALTVLASGDRLIVLETEVLPALAAGRWVLCDRYVYTGLAVHDDPTIRAIASRFVAPDLKILARASAEVVERRVRAREDEKHRFYNHAFIERQMAAFDRLAEELDIVPIDTEGPPEQACERLSLELSRLV